MYHGLRETATFDAWIRSPALRNLQEFDLCSFERGFPSGPYRRSKPLPPVAAFCFSETLYVATIGGCEFPDITAQAIHFPKFKKLELDLVSISESSLCTMIAGCLALECLLVAHSDGFHCVQINSISLRSICVKGDLPRGRVSFRELIIENTPCLERLLQFGSYDTHISVISTPKLGTLGCLSSGTRLALDLTVIQSSMFMKGLRVDSLMSPVRTIKILAVDIHALSLDVVIDLLKCFPCLERLYIESGGPGKSNLWRQKRRGFTSSFHIRPKKTSWQYYRGIKSHVDFATFFVENARLLELMTIQVSKDDYHEEFFAEHHKKLRLDSRASRGARFRFTTDEPHRCVSMIWI
ncbi:hypothetical protein ACQ4PT_048978 [Festuca glaucescens]